MEKDKKNVYYVYVILDQTKEGKHMYDGRYCFGYEPFYVGKGKNGRYSSHLKGGLSHNKELKQRINEIKEITKVDPPIIKIFYHLSEEDALIEERQAIKTIGTIYNKGNKGPLLNKSFSNVYTIDYYTNPNKTTYILEHPYVSEKEIFTSKHHLEDFCRRLGIKQKTLLDGKEDNGWTLTII